MPQVDESLVAFEKAAAARRRQQWRAANERNKRPEGMLTGHELQGMRVTGDVHGEDREIFDGNAARPEEAIREAYGAALGFGAVQDPLWLEEHAWGEEPDQGEVEQWISSKLDLLVLSSLAKRRRGCEAGMDEQTRHAILLQSLAYGRSERWRRQRSWKKALSRQDAPGGAR